MAARSATATYRSRHELVMAFMANIAMTSATCVTGRQKGNRGSRSGKPYAGVSGKALARQANENMRSVAEMIATLTDLDRPHSEWSVRQFVGNAIRWIHNRLPNEEQLKKLRSHETSHDYGCSAEEVPARWDAFLDELQSRLNHDSPQRLCAWVEYKLRYEIHPLADGSGRLATALSAWIMLRAGKHMPNYAFAERSQMHAKLREGFGAFETYYLDTCFRSAESNEPLTDVFSGQSVPAEAVAS